MNEISKNIQCISIRNGVELWIDEDRANEISGILSKVSSHTFIKLEGRLINTADISGIFTAQDMEESTRRRNGEWKCRWNIWHGKGTKCECKTREMTGDELAKFASGRL